MFKFVENFLSLFKKTVATPTPEKIFEDLRIAVNINNQWWTDIEITLPLEEDGRDIVEKKAFACIEKTLTKGRKVDKVVYTPRQSINFVLTSLPEREPATQQTYMCNGCGKNFLAYPSELPQYDVNKSSDQNPLIYCNGTQYACRPVIFSRTTPVNLNEIKKEMNFISSIGK